MHAYNLLEPEHARDFPTVNVMFRFPELFGSTSAVSQATQVYYNSKAKNARVLEEIQKSQTRI